MNEHGNHCARCGAILLKVDPSIAGDVAIPRQRVKYELLRTELDRLRVGQVSWADFSTWLERFHDDIQTRTQSLVESIQQSHGPGWNYYDEFKEEVETTFAGLEDYEQALHLLWIAVEGESLAEVDMALALFLRGAEKLNDALAINAQIQRENLFDAWGFT